MTCDSGNQKASDSLDGTQQRRGGTRPPTSILKPAAARRSPTTALVSPRLHTPPASARGTHRDKKHVRFCDGDELENVCSFVAWHDADTDDDEDDAADEEAYYQYGRPPSGDVGAGESCRFGCMAADGVLDEAHDDGDIFTEDEDEWARDEKSEQAESWVAAERTETTEVFVVEGSEEIKLQNTTASQGSQDGRACLSGDCDCGTGDSSPAQHGETTCIVTFEDDADADKEGYGRDVLPTSKCFEHLVDKKRKNVAKQDAAFFNLAAVTINKYSNVNKRTRPNAPSDTTAQEIHDLYEKQRHRIKIITQENSTCFYYSHKRDLDAKLQAIDDKISHILEQIQPISQKDVARVRDHLTVQKVHIKIAHKRYMAAAAHYFAARAEKLITGLNVKEMKLVQSMLDSVQTFGTGPFYRFEGGDCMRRCILRREFLRDATLHGSSKLGSLQCKHKLATTQLADTETRMINARQALLTTYQGRVLRL